MCEIETVFIVAVLLLVADGFCKNQVNSDEKGGHNSLLKSECYCEKE